MKKKASNAVEKQEPPRQKPAKCGLCGRDGLDWDERCPRCTEALDCSNPVIHAVPRFGWLLVRVRMAESGKEPWRADTIPGSAGTGLNDCLMGCVVGMGGGANIDSCPLMIGDWVLFDPMRWARPGITSVHADAERLFVPVHAILARLLI